MTDVASTAPPVASRPLGTPRSPGTVIVLALLTFGLYGLIWYPRNFGELQAYRGKGVGAVGGLLLMFVMVSPFLLPKYVRALCRGRQGSAGGRDDGPLELRPVDRADPLHLEGAGRAVAVLGEQGRQLTRPGRRA